MVRVHSKSGKFIALLPESMQGGFSVVVTTWGIEAFNSSWPCSRLRTSRPIRFEFASNGDLVDVNTSQDGEEMLALSQDAQEFGEQCMARRRTVAQ